jgi:hypothetical protein
MDEGPFLRGAFPRLRDSDHSILNSDYTDFRNFLTGSGGSLSGQFKGGGASSTYLNG